MPAAMLPVAEYSLLHTLSSFNHLAEQREGYSACMQALLYFYMIQ